jgi:glycylpeptide N-tetradecanoyltransferase
LKGIFQAIYTAGAFLPTPVTRCQYYHRNLNPPKLVKLGFSAVPRNSTVARMTSLFRVPNETSLPGMREIEKRDLKQASRLLRAYLARFDMAPLMSNKEVEHMLYAGRGKDVNGKREGQVVWTYVVEVRLFFSLGFSWLLPFIRSRRQKADPPSRSQDPSTHRLTDLFSFYSLPSTAVKHSSPSPNVAAGTKINVNAAYLFYYATTAAPSCADLGDGSVAVPVRNWKEETEEERKVLGDRLKALVGDALVEVQKVRFLPSFCPSSFSFFLSLPPLFLAFLPSFSSSLRTPSLLATRLSNVDTDTPLASLASFAHPERLRRPQHPHPARQLPFPRRPQVRKGRRVPALLPLVRIPLVYPLLSRR